MNSQERTMFVTPQGAKEILYDLYGRKFVDDILQELWEHGYQILPRSQIAPQSPINGRT